jgi:Lectin C-type domain
MKLCFVEMRRGRAGLCGWNYADNVVKGIYNHQPMSVQTSSLALLLAVIPIAGASPLSPPIENPTNHHIYILLESATWRTSEAEAVALGGHLATVRNQAEEDWIFDTFGKYGDQQRLLWIGLSDSEKKFHFSWSSGESASFTRWAPGEPNNAGRGEDYVAIYYPNHDEANHWNDWNDRVKDPIGLPMNGVVEIIPGTSIPPVAMAPGDTANAVSLEISPTLIITNDSGKIQLSWPASATNYVLEAATDLSQPFTLFGYSEWTNQETGFITVTITNPVSRMFFRLRAFSPP